jgi:hypothetical protein
MYIRMIGQFYMSGPAGQDLTPRGTKARALVAMLCRTPDHCRPRRWLENRLWSDRGPEQASGSLRQTLSELRKTLGPLAGQLRCDRDCVSLTGFVTDIDRAPDAARLALSHGREFLEGIDIIDPAFCTWLREERERLAVTFGQGDAVQAGSRQSQAFSLRLGALPEGTGTDVARDLAAAIARLTAEYLLKSEPDSDRFRPAGDGLPEGLDLHVEGAWSRDRAHLKLRVVAQADKTTIWSQRLIASRASEGEEGQRAAAPLVFETTDAPLM